MAYFALFLSLTFSLWLVVRDCMRRKGVSAAVWIPTILMLILGSRPVSMWMGGSLREGSLGNVAERSVSDQVFFFFVLASSALIAISRGVDWQRYFGSNKAILLFYGFFAISVFWSGDPVGSTKRLVKDFGMLMVVAVILSEKEPFQAARAVYVRCASVLFPLSVVFIRYFPEMGRAYTIIGEPMYTGVTTQKNSLGEIVLVFTLFLVWDYLEMREASHRQWWKLPWDRVVLLVMGFYLLHISQSKTALLCLLISVALVIRTGWLASRMVSRVALMGAMAVPVLMFFAQQFSSVIAPIVEAMGRNMTFTGRTDIWDHITIHTVNPWIGAGYWNFWGGVGGMAISDAMQTPVPNAHCGYVDMYLDGGIVGLIVLGFTVFVCGNRLIPLLRRDRYQRVRFAMLIAMIIYNLSETTFARIGPTWFTTLLMIVNFPFAKSVQQRLSERSRTGKKLPAGAAVQPIAYA